MKRNLLSTLALCAGLWAFSTGSASAQIGQGKFLAGGGLGLSFGTSTFERPTGNQNTTIVTEYRYTNFSLTPKVGYFLTDALALGLSLNLSANSSKNKDGSTTDKNSSYTVGPFVRYYFPPKIFLEGGVGFGRTSEDGDAQTSIFSYSFGAGYAAFLNDHVALEPTIQYVGTNYTSTSDNRRKDKYGNLQIGLGLQVYF